MSTEPDQWMAAVSGAVHIAMLAERWGSVTTVQAATTTCLVGEKPMVRPGGNQLQVGALGIPDTKDRQWPATCTNMGTSHHNEEIFASGACTHLHTEDQWSAHADT